MGTRRVKFIGKTEYKKDNVCRSGLFWPYRGAIVECDDGIAVRLFQHPDVWVEAKPDDDGKPIVESMSEKLTGNLTREQKIQTAIDIIESENALLEVANHFGAEFFFESDMGDQNSGPTLTGTADADVVSENDSATGLSDVDQATSDAETEKTEPEKQVTFSADRGEAIIQAVNQLDRDDSAHFTKDNVPRVEAIEEMLGFSVTAQERTTAWDAIQAEEHELDMAERDVEEG